ncbi:GntR family transcriptional regulator [Azospirillum sp. A39]|uniref:GntR family transcriptional regulator n=1 Tax=Azospirillum sp. A39 TaxID=3462279 RepID=UPI0040452DA7
MDGQRLAGRRQTAAADPSAGPDREAPPASERKGGTRADEVRRAIEEDIFLGRLRPGSRLDEESLAQRFRISRTPIREAILQLVHAGLVEKQPRQGAVVAPLQLHRMMQMFEVMSEIEGLCARFAARRMSEEERRTLRRLHDESRAFMQARDLDAYYAKNRAIHEAIQAGSHNEPLQDIARSLSARLGPYRRYQLNHPSRVGDSFDEHGGVVDAILAGDPERAYQAMRRHVTIQIDIFTEYVSIMGGSGIHP